MKFGVMMVLALTLSMSQALAAEDEVTCHVSSNDPSIPVMEGMSTGFATLQAPKKGSGAATAHVFNNGKYLLTASPQEDSVSIGIYETDDQGSLRSSLTQAAYVLEPQSEVEVALVSTTRNKTSGNVGIIHMNVSCMRPAKKKD